MKRERVDKSLQIDQQIANAERQFAAANERVRYWGERLQKLRGERLNRSLAAQSPLGRSTKKNQKKLSVWYCVRGILLETVDTAGLTTDALYRAVSEEHLRLNIITFRWYLREFSQPERQLILQQGGRWQLTDKVRSNG